MSDKPHIKLKAHGPALSDFWYRYLDSLPDVDESSVPFWTRHMEGVVQAERYKRSQHH